MILIISNDIYRPQTKFGGIFSQACVIPSVHWWGLHPRGRWADYPIGDNERGVRILLECILVKLFKLFAKIDEVFSLKYKTLKKNTKKSFFKNS